MAIKYSSTNLFKYQISDFIKNSMFPDGANTYVGIGKPIRWGIDTNETIDEVENTSVSTNYINQSHRNMMAIKKIEAADISLVIPRLDWVVNVIYDKYNDDIELSSHEKKTQIAVVTANATVPSLTQSGTLRYVAAVYCIADLSFIF